MPGPANHPMKARGDILANCTRWIHGHGRRRPKEALADLVTAVNSSELADGYGQGKIIREFEDDVAGLLGHEAGLFLPSGTMAQQIALRLHCERQGVRTVAYHPTCHMEINEQRGLLHVHNVRSRLVGEPWRLITKADLEEVTEPVAALLLELPQRWIGGQLPSREALEEQVALARERGWKLHLDGARLWESAPFYGCEVDRLASLFDTVYVSFYKGLGGIAGALLAGPKSFIDEARVWLRRVGGNLIHLYPYVISARAGLQKRGDRFARYTERARELAAVLNGIDGLVTRPKVPHTSLFHTFVRGEADIVLEEALKISADTGVALFGWARGTDMPGHCWFEWQIGDAAEEIEDGEVAELFQRLMDAVDARMAEREAGESEEAGR